MRSISLPFLLLLFLTPFVVRAQQPLLPTATGTYYYEGYDAGGDQYVYIHTSGSYYYVGPGGAEAFGGQATVPVSSPCIAVIAAGGMANFLFNNTHTNLYTLASGTLIDSPIIVGGTSYAARSGTWHVQDTTFTLLNTADVAAIHVTGYTVSGTAVIAHPATFIGENVNAIVDHSLTTSRRALALYNGGAAFIHGGTLSKTGTAINASEVIHLVGNQEGRGSSSHFYGEDLAIIAEGPAVSVINMGNGNNTFTLKNSTITSITTLGNTSQAILLADTQNLGGNHFHGEGLVITNNSGRVFGFGMGDNTVTLVSSTVMNTGAGAAFGWNATTSTTRRSFDKGTSVYLQDTMVGTTADYSPIFQMIGDWGGATVIGGTLMTSGIGSTILRIVAQNDLVDQTKFTAIFQDTCIEAAQGSIVDINFAASDTTNYGQAGGGAKNLTNNFTDTVRVIFQSATAIGATSLRIGAAGSHDIPYHEYSYVIVNDSFISGRMEMIAGGGVNETSGGYLTLTASNSQFSGGVFITGTELARRPNNAVFHVYDSTFEGDIVLTNRGNANLHFENTPIDGALSLSGSTQVLLNLADSPITGGITIADTAVLTGTISGAECVGPITARGGRIDLTLDRGPSSGGIAADGTASVNLLIGGTLNLEGSITAGDNATLAITLRDTASYTGDIAILDRATLALGATRAGTFTLNGNITLAGTWRIPGKTHLAGNLTLIAPDGTIAIENAGPDSLTLANGLTGTGLLDILSIDGDALRASEIRVIHDQSNTFTTATSAPLVRARPIDYGLAGYTLENRADGAWLVGGLNAGFYGAGGAAVFNSQALVIEDWFAALAPLDNQLASIRQSAASATGARGDTGSFWLRGRADTTRVDTGNATLDFTSRTMGMVVGVDSCWSFDKATFTSGLFAETARTDHDFINTADGRATSAGGGLYAIYQHRAGLYAAAIARFTTYENALGTNSPNNALDASYHTRAGGASIEAGWRFAFKNGWWVEPAAQVAFATFPGVSYTTKSTSQHNIITITTGDARATQALARVAGGKSLDKNWLLHSHVAFADVSASGGKFTIPDLSTKPGFTIAGSRFEVSLGVVRLIGRASRISINATHVTASDYKRPWVFSAGWSIGW